METKTIKKILLPFDFNEHYVNSFKVAEEIAHRSGASLTLVNTINHLGVPGGSYGIPLSVPVLDFQRVVEERENTIRAYTNKSMVPSDRIRICIELGSYNEKMAEYTRLDDYDLIVVPDFNKNVIGRFFSDLDPLEIMERTKVPLITVNKEVDIFKIERIVLAIGNVSNWFGKVPLTVAIAKLTGAKIYVLGLNSKRYGGIREKVEKNLWLCREYLKRCDQEFEVNRVVCKGDLSADVLNQAQITQADLIAISPPSRYTKMKSFLNRHFYNKIVSQGNTPVLGYAMPAT